MINIVVFLDVSRGHCLLSRFCFMSAQCLCLWFCWNVKSHPRQPAKEGSPLFVFQPDEQERHCDVTESSYKKQKQVQSNLMHYITWSVCDWVVTALHSILIHTIPVYYECRFINHVNINMKNMWKLIGINWLVHALVLYFHYSCEKLAGVCCSDVPREKYYC